jgi:16S rRNA G966 N2-methylase RsmD/DNA-directed RNA polymerase subunit RPC12/RpoP
MAASEVSHIDYAIPANTHPPMYMIHKFWARKPHNVVREYIEHYTSSGEIVLDPFCGSGVTVGEALKSGRKAIGTDLNPISVFLATLTVTRADLNAFTTAVGEIEGSLRSLFTDLYGVKCPRCGRDAVVTNSVMSYVVQCPSCKKDIVMAEAKKAPGKRQNIYRCPNCSNDFSYANQSIKNEITLEVQTRGVRCKHTTSSKSLKLPELTTRPKWVPRVRLDYPGGKAFITRRRASDVGELFSRRSLVALSHLFQRICEEPEGGTRDLLKLTFSATLPQASRMMIWTEGAGPSWKMPEYIVFPLHMELNVWDRFSNRVKATIRSKTDSNVVIPQGKFGKQFSDLLSDADRLVDRRNVFDLPGLLPDQSVDFVFTDPPYGGDIQYFELDFLRSAWLSEAGKDTRFDNDWWKDEITINRSQGKDFGYYHKMMTAAFQNIYRSLRRGRWALFTFHNTDIGVYNSILEAGIQAGLDLEHIVYQPPAVASPKAQIQPYGSAVGDYYVRFRRPS